VEIELEVMGIDAVEAVLGDRSRLEGELAAAMEQCVAELVAEVGQYPPPVAGSRYQRTGALGRSLEGQVELSEGEVWGRVSSSISYAPYVIGPQQTRLMEERGWERMRSVVERKRGWIEEQFRAAVRGALAQQSEPPAGFEPAGG